MKLIGWNSQGAFRKKHALILSLNPDILIVPECESGEKLKFGKLTPEPKDFIWHGDNKNKGIGIFSYSDYRFELMQEYTPEFRYIIPIKVLGPSDSFLLFAVWAMNDKENYEARYIGQVWLVINHYSNLLAERTILLGDFNSNKIWDYKDRVGNHTDVVEKLQAKKIFSLYHKQHSLEHGNETTPTFYMFRNKDKQYHIDYCFASDEITKRGYEFNVGKYEDWNTLSDHVPIIAQIK